MIFQHVQGASIVDFRIDDILILSGADFWPGIDQFITQGFFFPSDLHFDYTAPFDFLLRDQDCFIEVFSFNGPKFSALS